MEHNTSPLHPPIAVLVSKRILSQAGILPKHFLSTTLFMQEISCQRNTNLENLYFNFYFSLAVLQTEKCGDFYESPNSCHSGYLSSEIYFCKTRNSLVKVLKKDVQIRLQKKKISLCKALGFFCVSH